MVVHANFTDPALVSDFYQMDLFRTRIKNRELFVSKETGQPI